MQASQVFVEQANLAIGASGLAGILVIDHHLSTLQSTQLANPSELLLTRFANRSACRQTEPYRVDLVGCFHYGNIVLHFLFFVKWGANPSQ